MNWLDRIKRVFFTERDLGFQPLAEELQEREHWQRIINHGADSRALMMNSAFQTAVAEIYLTLEAQLDNVDDTQPDAEVQISSIRAQRRALRQICALLDNKIAAQETVEQTLKERSENES